jgi:high-affinity iron transporter
MVRTVAVAAALCSSVALWVAASATAAAPEPWKLAADAELALSDAGSALILGDQAEAGARLASAEDAVHGVLAGRPQALRDARRALADAESAVLRGDEPALSAARAAVWTTILHASLLEATSAAAAGDVAQARSWLLVREFRPPTRFSRAAADATVALDELAAGNIAPRKAAATVRRDLLDTYDARLRTALAGVRDADAQGFGSTRAEMGAFALGYWAIVAPTYGASKGLRARRALAMSFEQLAAASATGGKVSGPLAKVERALESFRAAPLTQEEVVRRAGQLDRFLRLVPIEYGRGVSDGRVTLEFEIQEAVTFRDGAASAFHDLEPSLAARGAAATRRLGLALDELGVALADAARGDAVADPTTVKGTTEEALALISDLYPSEWKEAAETADFDVISATLDRLQAAAAAGDWKQAEQARLEAYGVFELGPEQRLRGLAPSLFQEVEGYFWYGAEGYDGLVQLIKRRSTAGELAATRAALDDALTRAEERVGSGAGSSVSVITNSALIVFREGLEAVLILAALMASLVGDKRRYRRPMMYGVGIAFLASVLTWVVAQTLLTSLARYGEKLEAVVSLFAIGVLLLILNWFFHKMYWQENLQNLHQRKRRVLTGAGLSLATAQVLGLVLLGFTSVYREGFETVLFLQAMTLEAGALTVLQGVLLGLAGVVGVFFLVIKLERKLPHKKLLIATGILITGVLVVMVGTTVQTMQKVGWIGVTPIEGLEFPYWAGLWLGLFPTWQGLIAQAAALAFVIGSYVAAEGLQRRRRAARIASTASPSAGALDAGLLSQATVRAVAERTERETAPIA